MYRPPPGRSYKAYASRQSIACKDVIEFDIYVFWLPTIILCEFGDFRYVFYNSCEICGGSLF